jgi:hypothetical protein
MVCNDIKVVIAVAKIWFGLEMIQNENAYFELSAKGKADRKLRPSARTMEHLGDHKPNLGQRIMDECRIEWEENKRIRLCY